MVLAESKSRHFLQHNTSPDCFITAWDDDVGSFELVRQILQVSEDRAKLVDFDQTCKLLEIV